MKKLIAILLVLVLAVGILAGCGEKDSKPAADAAAPAADAGKTYEFKLTTFVNENEDFAKVVNKFIEEVKTRTDGKVVITPFFGGSLVPQNETPAAITEGAVDMGMYAPNIMVSEMPLIALNCYNLSAGLDRQGILEASQKLWFENEESKAILAKEEARLNTKFFGPNILGTVGLTAGEVFTGTADLQGKKVTSEGGMDDVWKAFGLTPVYVNTPDLYESFSRSVVDVVSLLTAPTAQLKLDEIGKCYREWDNYYMIGLPICINMDKWNSLPAEYQDAMIEASKVSSAYSAELNEASVAAAWDQFKANGLDVGYMPDEDRANYVKYNEDYIVKTIWADYTKALGEEEDGAKLLEIWKSLIQ